MQRPGSGECEAAAFHRTGRGPVVLYELNEVPWRVFDWFVAQRPKSHIGALLRDATQLTTRTYDDGELHPWTTWPSLHRGVYNSVHNIRFLNQDRSCAGAFPPIWETLAARGVRVGVFGSLQSYPVPSELTNYAFYVPDTFAPAPDAYPEVYSSFQAVNLRQTKADGAVAQPLKIDAGPLRELARLPAAGVSLSTFSKLVRQILMEKIDPRHRARRSTLQAPVAFDVFMHAIRRDTPQFATFFTNHVAGAMHRYWKHAFPEDFGLPAQPGFSFHRDTLLHAMDIADEQVGVLRRVTRRANGMLVVATSMGQEAIDRGRYFGELRLADPAALMSALGFTRNWRDLLAMQPDFNFAFDSTADAELFAGLLSGMRGNDGERMWKRVRIEGATVNAGLSMIEEVVLTGRFTYADASRGHQPRDVADFGFTVIHRDPGTGYHQPLGCLICAGPGIPHSAARKEIPLAAVRDMLLRQFEATPVTAEKPVGEVWAS